MSNEAPAQLIYLTKVLSGLAALTAVVLVALWLPESRLSDVQQNIGLALLVALAIVMVPLVRLAYRRTDELEALLHKNSSVASLSVLASASCILGILQASKLIPLFNQFWMLGILVAVWGVNLMLADRHFK